MGGGQRDPAVVLEEGGDLDEVAEGFVVPHAAVALEDHESGGLLGRVSLGEHGVADLAGGRLDVQRSSERLALGLVLGRVQPDGDLGHGVHGRDGGVVGLVERCAEDAEGQSGGLLEDRLRVLEVFGLRGDVGAAEFPERLAAFGPAAVIPAMVPELDHAAVLDRVGLDPGDVVGVGLGERIADDAHRHHRLLGLGPFGHALEADLQAAFLPGTHIVHLPDDDLVLRGGEGGEGEQAE